MAPKRLSKIHSAPPPHKTPKVAPRLPSSGVAQSGGDPRDRHQQRLLQAAAGVALAAPRTGQKLSLEQVQRV